MPNTEKPDARRERRQSPVLRILEHVWSEWRPEILIVLVVALAVFLLVERMQIRETVLAWMRQGYRALEGLAGGIMRGLVAFALRTTVSDLIGYALLTAALVVIVWRARWRVMRMSRFTERQCPACGADLRRARRHWHDRVLNLVIPARRFQCRNRECRWDGVRVGTSRHQ